MKIAIYKILLTMLGKKKEQLPALTISPFLPEQQTEVKNLILAGLAERWGRLDPDKNPDLNNISQSYANALFLVAVQNNRIVGTGALVPKSAGIGEIVRMSVAGDMRRKGIGERVLRQLCKYAKSNGYKSLMLETTETWHDAIEFYRKFGFEVTHDLDGDVYFALDLSKFRL